MPPRKPPAERDAVPPELAHNPQKIPAPDSPSSADLSDPEGAPPEEPGVSIDAVEIGGQFLRDATEQYNFESEVRPEVDHDPLPATVGQMISDATLEAADQGDFELPVSHALSDDQPEVRGEPEERRIDLTMDAIAAGSLFDQPVADQELVEQEQPGEADDFDLTHAPAFREAEFVTDDPTEVPESRRERIQALLDERVKKRLRVERLPGREDEEEEKKEAAATPAPAKPRSAARPVEPPRPRLGASRESTAPHPFVEGVRQRLPGHALAPDTELERTVRSVVSVLVQRLPWGTAQRVLAALPGLLPSLEGREREEAPTPFGFDELLDRVGGEAQVTSDAAHLATQAVFAELRSRLPAETTRQVSSHLPADIFALWETDAAGTARGAAARHAPSRGPAAPGPELRVSHPVLERLEGRVKLPENVTGAGAFAVTMCLLLLGLPAARAAELRGLLPAPLSDLLFRCTEEREEPATEYEASEFLDALGAELGVAPDRAAHIACAVFQSVREGLPRGEAEQVGAELPKGLRKLWTSGERGPEAPPRRPRSAAPAALGKSQV